MSSEHLMFAGIFGLALSASACAAPTDAPEEQQERLGKVSSAQSYHCSCAGSPGEWTANYSSAQEAADRIGYHCAYGGSCSTGSSGGGNPSSGSHGYDNPGSGGSSGSGPGSGPGGGTTSGGSSGGSSSGGSSSGAPANHSSIPRDGQFRQTADYWNWLRTYHHERHEAGFNDGDAVRFFDFMKEARNYQNGAAWAAFVPMSYAAGLAIYALSALSDAQIDAIAAKYEATGNDQGIRVVLDVTTDISTGRIENYLIYNISNGQLLGQISIVHPAVASNGSSGGSGQCQYGVYGDVSVAAQNCSNGITACNSGYNCS